jgi:branched-chain amino acid aminotransferase
MGQYEAYDKGGETALLVDRYGNIKEGPGFNIFAVKDNILITPSKGVLHGVTRKTAIEIALAKGYEVKIEALTSQFARVAE